MKSINPVKYVSIAVIIGSILTISVTEVHALKPPQQADSPSIPHLRDHGSATQLVVDGEAFLMLAGELHNSSSSSLEYMAPVWNKLVALNLNTVLAPLSWQLIEPVEGEFDFSLIDGLIERARMHNLRLVFLWFGSWKNGVSSYVPNWVKLDQERFPRAQNSAGENMEVLSPFSREAQRADARAFSEVMRHIRSIDSEEHTVLMMQVENEVGILGSPRDYSPLADSAFAQNVPAELLDHLQEHRTSLAPALYEIWQSQGFPAGGTWTEVFGKGPAAAEIFMAWHYAQYIGGVTEAGKEAYPLPMYVNAWLVQNDNQIPGDYPSGGPVARMLDVWRAGAPAIDFFAPDIYLQDFKGVTTRYTRAGNPLMIPEARRGEEAARNAFWA
ncbi:MAG TPA: beta-galactosidase, partial [bacterium]|nr:beta-galactosidase [bacterium]